MYYKNLWRFKSGLFCFRGPSSTLAPCCWFKNRIGKNTCTVFRFETNPLYLNRSLLISHFLMLLKIWSRGPQSCLTQWNEAMPCGATQKMGNGGEVWQNVVHWRREWQTTSVFLPWELQNSMKREKDRTLKDELPRSVGDQCATGN